MMRFRLGALTTLTALCLLGCGQQEKPMAAVKGKVTLDGAPLDQGMIQFLGDATHGPASLEIKNGEYQGKVFPGPALVRITSPKVIGQRKLSQNPGSPTIDETAERIPGRYNVKTELVANIALGENTADFELKSE